MLTDKELKEKLVRDLLRFLPILIEEAKEKSWSERQTQDMIDDILDRVNRLKTQIKKLEKDGN